MTSMWARKQKGFTIVELLIVIVVIAILAAITIVAFNGIQDRARQSKVTNDLAQLQKAIIAARVSQDKLLSQITNNTYTAAQCSNKTGIQSLAEVPASDACWVVYNNTLAAISTASGINVSGLKDPYNQPYMIDENELTDSCTKDKLGTYNIPYVAGVSGQTRSINISNYRTDC